MTSFVERWNNFLFKPASPDNLGLCRIILFGSMSLFYAVIPSLLPAWGRHEDFSAWGQVSNVFWIPTWLFARFHLLRFSTEVLAVLQLILKFTLALSCIGLFTRLSTAISFFLGLYLFGLPNNFGKTHHFETILVFAFLVMALSRCGDGWSVDCLIRTARRGTDSSSQRPSVSGEYTWPVRMIWLVMSLILFAAGVSKLRHSGLAWITSDSMAIFLLQHNYHIANSDPLTSWGLNLARHAWLPHLFAAATVILEVGYPIALFSRRARWFIVPSAVLMFMGIAVLMGPNFYQLMLCQLLWAPWDRVAAWVAAHCSNEKKYTLVFDGDCGLCQRTVAVVRSLDLLRWVDFQDPVKQWPEVEKRFPQLHQDQCLAEMHVITSSGQARTGFDAYRALAWVLPLGWILLPGLYLPGARRVGSRIYRTVASNRHRGTCPVAVTTSLPDTRVVEKVEARETHQKD